MKHGELSAAFLQFSFSVKKLFEKKGQVKIKAIFDNIVEHRGSLAKIKSDFQMLGSTKDVRIKLGKSFGDEVSVKVWEDKEERIVEISNDFLTSFFWKI